MAQSWIVNIGTETKFVFVGDKTENKERGKGKGSLQIPLPASPSREDEEREKSKASPEGQVCTERWIFPGSRVNWLYQTDFFFFWNYQGAWTEYRVTQQAAQIQAQQEHWHIHPPLISYRAPHCTVPSYTLQV